MILLTENKKNKIFKTEQVSKLTTSKSRKRKDIVNLYLFNPTMRNPKRLLEFISLASQFISKYGYKTKITETELISFVAELIEKEGQDEEDKILKMNGNDLTFRSINKKFSEINALGFIDFNQKTPPNNKKDIVECKSNEEEPQEPYIWFNQTQYPIDLFKNIKSEDQLSSFYMLILKREGVLNFMTDLILKTSSLWRKQNGRRYGVSAEEIRFIYRLFPHLNRKKIISSNDVAQFIINYRNSFKDSNEKLNKKDKLNYKDYLLNQSFIIEKQYAKIKFQKYDTCNDYVDVLLRTLTSSSCFLSTFKGSDSYLSLNDFFVSKLSYFYKSNYKDLLLQFLENRLSKKLESYEVNFFNNELKEDVPDPTVYRIDRTKRKKANIYTEYYNKEELNQILDLDKTATNGWSDFEHINNWLLCYHIKTKSKSFTLKEEHITHAIKFDYGGNHLSATTPGIADMFVSLPNMNVVVESSLRFDYNLRVNEFIQVTSHAEQIYQKNEEKPLLVFIVVKCLNDDFISDFKEKNINMVKMKYKGNNKKIIYLPIEYENYKKLMIKNNEKLLPLLYTYSYDFFENLNDFSENCYYKGIKLF